MTDRDGAALRRDLVAACANHNAAIANGLVIEARRLARRIERIERMLEVDSAPKIGSTSECAWCGEPIAYAENPGWHHPDLVGIGVLGGDGVSCDVVPVATPGRAAVPPV